MDQLLWSFDDCVRFLDHRDAPLRHWAINCLTKHYPKQAPDALVPVLDDKASYHPQKAAKCIGEHGDPDKHGAALLERLHDATGDRFGYLIKAFAQLRGAEALPLIANRLEKVGRGRRGLSANEALTIAEVLGKIGNDEARQMLWGLLKVAGNDTMFSAAVLRSLLGLASPAEVPELVQWLRTSAPASDTSYCLQSFAAGAECFHLMDNTAYRAHRGLQALLEDAEWWLARKPELSAECLAELEDDFEHSHRDVFPICVREARRIVEARGDDVSAWRASWEAGTPLTGCRKHAPYILEVLQAFAHRTPPYPEERERESELALALLSYLSIQEDHEAVLERAEDETAALLRMLGDVREQVLPDIVERVAALGPEIVPDLIQLLDSNGQGWGEARIAEVIERIAREHPGSCDAAAPALIEAINDDQTDDMEEACSEALVAIGPGAVQQIAQHLSDDDSSRGIYLADVLSQIGTEAAAKALVDPLLEAKPWDEWHIYNLKTLGAPGGIDVLYDDTQPAGAMVAEALLVLCELNGVEKPELEEWRKTVAEQARRSRSAHSEMLGHERAWPATGRDPSEDWSTPGAAFEGEGRKHKKVGKKEKKKRAAQRKAGKRKKRKKKR